MFKKKKKFIEVSAYCELAEEPVVYESLKREYGETCWVATVKFKTSTNVRNGAFSFDPKQKDLNKLGLTMEQFEHISKRKYTSTTFYGTRAEAFVQAQNHVQQLRDLEPTVEIRDLGSVLKIEEK